MYLLFRYHDWEPNRFNDMPMGRQIITHAFIVQEAEERKKEADALKGD